MLKTCSNFLGLAVLLAACEPHVSLSSTPSGVSLASLSPKKAGLEWLQNSNARTSARTKTEEVQGEFIGPAIDCDGDGIRDESRIVFANAGVGEECVEAPGEIPEPPFQQTYLPTSAVFRDLLPAVGWQTQYQCGDG